MVMWSNWHRARLLDFDFSPAVVRQGLADDQRANGVGIASVIQTTGHSNGFKVRNGGGIQGRDAVGNWWMIWSMRTEAWPIVEAKVRALASKKSE